MSVRGLQDHCQSVTESASSTHAHIFLARWAHEGPSPPPPEEWIDAELTGRFQNSRIQGGGSMVGDSMTVEGGTSSTRPGEAVQRDSMSDSSPPGSSNAQGRIHQRLFKRIEAGFYRFWRSLVRAVSFEFLLRPAETSNGGGIILLRTISSSTVLYIVVLGLTQAIDPSRTWQPDWLEFRLALLDHITWFGAFFAGIYASLLARFGSQWQYLAGLYNQIMAVEARTASDPLAKPVIAQWKAGFLHDAFDLHLASKPLFVSVVRRWAKDEAVREHFIRTTPHGEERLRRLEALRNYPGLPPEETGTARSQP